MTWQTEYKLFVFCSLLNMVTQLGTDMNKDITGNSWAINICRQHTFNWSHHVLEDRWLFQTLNFL